MLWTCRFDHIPWEIQLEVSGQLPKALQFLYDCSESLAYIAGKRCDSFPVGIELCLLLWIRFIISMDRILWWNQVLESFHFVDLRFYAFLRIIMVLLAFG